MLKGKMLRMIIWSFISLTVCHCQLWPSDWKCWRTSCSQENERARHTTVWRRKGPAGGQVPYNQKIYRCRCPRHEAKSFCCRVWTWPM